MTGDHGFVTPEAVPLDMPEATVGSRGVAIVVDWVLQGLAFTGLVVTVGSVLESRSLPEWVPVSVLLILSFLIFFGYPIAFETAWRGGGRTPGKALMGLRVVTVEGAPVRFRHAAIRAALGLVDFWLTFGFAAVVSCLSSRRSQRLGDFVAGTVVRRERTATATASAQRFTVPAAARGFADSLDTSALRPRDYAAVRAYLLRADGLTGERRDEIGRQLLAALADRLGGAPLDAPARDGWDPDTVTPGHLPPHVVLQAVAARYQERHRSSTSGLTS